MAHDCVCLCVRIDSPWRSCLIHSESRTLCKLEPGGHCPWYSRDQHDTPHWNRNASRYLGNRHGAANGHRSSNGNIHWPWRGLDWRRPGRFPVWPMCYLPSLSVYRGRLLCLSHADIKAFRRLSQERTSFVSKKVEYTGNWNDATYAGIDLPILTNYKPSRIRSLLLFAIHDNKLVMKFLVHTNVGIQYFWALDAVSSR